MEALDDSPRLANWKFRAMGCSLGEALAEAPRDARITLRLPVGEVRYFTDAARRHGLGRDTFARRVLGTWMVAMEGVEPDDIPFTFKGGILRP